MDEYRDEQAVKNVDTEAKLAEISQLRAQLNQA